MIKFVRMRFHQDKLCHNQVKWNKEKGDLEVKQAKTEEKEDENEIKALKNNLAKGNKELVMTENRFEHCVAHREAQSGACGED